MKRRNFLKAAGAFSAISATGMAANLSSFASNAAKEIYEWRIYTLTGEGASLDEFLKDVLLPAYNRLKVKTGAFKLYKVKEGEKDQRHVLLVYPNIASYLKVKKSLWEDAKFLAESKTFFETTAPSPVYSAFESYLSEAFDKIPTHRLPDPARGLLEIRIYHSPNEEANKRKIKMFNTEEINLFDKVKINSVLYGDILSGPNLPAIMYLTWYKDEETRSKVWADFVAHPDWQRMSKLPQYANTATRNQSIFLTPLPFSQF
ncbi:MAG: NIPSNAP family protein [Tannerella sp.]|jgi:hypothetical protein|nr:NIPSNAP family protein [Tannerella sp.]